MSGPIYTADQVATAAKELRAAAGAEEELFTPEQVLAMLGDEIRLLRERGFTDDRIADIFAGIEIPVTAQQIAEAPDSPDFS